MPLTDVFLLWCSFKDSLHMLLFLFLACWHPIVRKMFEFVTACVISIYLYTRQLSPQKD